MEGHINSIVEINDQLASVELNLHENLFIPSIVTNPHEIETETAFISVFVKKLIADVMKEPISDVLKASTHICEE